MAPANQILSSIQVFNLTVNVYETNNAYGFSYFRHFWSNIGKGCLSHLYGQI